MVTSAMHGVQWRFGLGALMWLIAFAVTPGAAFADAVGTVLFVVGDVKVSTGGAPGRSLGKSDVIVEGDILATGENSSAQIKMRDGGVLAVRANTELKFDIFKIARNPGEPQSSVMSLVKGSLRAITGLIGRNNKQEYKISTAVATIGIRGTDHEAAFIPLALPGVPAGAYSKVNVGQTTLTTTAGTVLVNPNQMGFASSPNAAPQIRPVNANLFTAVPPPATASSGKKDGSGQAATTTAGGGESTQQGGQSSQQGGQSSQQGGQTAQNENQNQGQGQPSQSQAQTQGAQAGSQSGNQAAATPMATTTITPTTTIVPVQLTSGTLTLNTTTQTISTSSGTTTSIINGYVAFSAATPPTSAPPPTSVAAYAGGEIAVQYQSTNVGSAYIAPASNIVVPSTSSTSPQTISFSMPASVTSDYFSNYTSMTSYAATAASVMSLPSGIRYGASPFSSYSFSSTGSYTQLLGGGGLSQWIVGPQAYFDANYQSNGLPIVAQLSYSLAGGTSPVGSGPNGTNVTGTITSATVNANLTAQTVSASVGVTALGNTYLASASNMRFSTFSTLPSGNNYAANPFSGSAVVTNGSTCSTSTCGGYISGGFTGQNYAGALLSYNLYDSGAGISNLGGVAALSLSPSPSSSAPPTPTGNYLVGNDYYVSLANSVTGPPGVLTGYSDSQSSTTVTCDTCAVTSTTSVTQSTGISYGRWDQGTVQSSYSYSNSGMGGQLYWITGPEPTPYYLPQVLTQQATYTFAGGAAGTGAGPGTVDSGSLTANFSKQTVAVNLAGTANVGTSGSPMNVSWTASTSNALIRANCSANGCFSAGSYYASTSPGYLTTTIDGQSAFGNLSGQFTGANLTGAIVSFGLWPATTTIGTNSNIQGVAAFSGAGADPLTPYRLAAVLINDSAYSMGSPEIRIGYQPAAAVGFDSGSGMLNQILVPPNSASGNSSTNSLTTSSLSFSGGTVSPSSGFLGANSGAGTACNPCTDPVTGISWGRWSSVTVTKNDLINNIAGLPTQVAGGGVHWISTPSLIGPVTLPISGTYSYVVAGGTNPTDSTGAQGVLNSAALTANFTQQTVNLGVNLSMPNAAITASASNVPIYKGAEFSTGSYSKSPLSVTCTGTACGASPQGKVGGVFVGSGGQGAVMGYGFMPNPAASNTITGVVSFRR